MGLLTIMVPAVHISDLRVSGFRVEGIADHYWPWPGSSFSILPSPTHLPPTPPPTFHNPPPPPPPLSLPLLVVPIRLVLFLHPSTLRLYIPLCVRLFVRLFSASLVRVFKPRYRKASATGDPRRMDGRTGAPGRMDWRTFAVWTDGLAHLIVHSPAFIQICRDSPDYPARATRILMNDIYLNKAQRHKKTLCIERQ